MIGTGLTLSDFLLVTAHLAVTVKMEWSQSQHTGMEMINLGILIAACISQCTVLGHFAGSTVGFQVQIIGGYIVTIYLLEILSYRKVLVVQKNMLQHHQILPGQWNLSLFLSIILLLLCQLIADSVVGMIGLLIAFSILLSYVYLLRRAGGPLVLNRIFWGIVVSAVIEGIFVIWRIFIVDGNSTETLTVDSITPLLYVVIIIHKLVITHSVGFSFWDVCFHKRYEILDDRLSSFGVDTQFNYKQEKDTSLQ